MTRTHRAHVLAILLRLLDELLDLLLGLGLAELTRLARDRLRPVVKHMIRRTRHRYSSLRLRVYAVWKDVSLPGLVLTEKFGILLARFTPAHFDRFARARRKETRRNSMSDF